MRLRLGDQDGLSGGKDRGIPLDTLEKVRAALKAAETDAGHGFHADYHPAYYKASAEDGFKRLQEWFKQNGAA
ncbi:MAG: dienelactone hydrolase family protein [Acidobacteria bacterium]|nr:dienelactone hydrolase family protein [Acidobacteriota bacterium]